MRAEGEDQPRGDESGLADARAAGRPDRSSWDEAWLPEWLADGDESGSPVDPAPERPAGADSGPAPESADDAGAVPTAATVAHADRLVHESPVAERSPVEEPLPDVEAAGVDGPVQDAGRRPPSRPVAEAAEDSADADPADADPADADPAEGSPAEDVPAGPGRGWDDTSFAWPERNENPVAAQLLAEQSPVGSRRLDSGDEVSAQRRAAKRLGTTPDLVAVRHPVTDEGTSPGAEAAGFDDRPFPAAEPAPAVWSPASEPASVTRVLSPPTATPRRARVLVPLAVLLIGVVLGAVFLGGASSSGPAPTAAVQTQPRAAGTTAADRPGIAATTTAAPPTEAGLSIADADIPLPHSGEPTVVGAQAGAGSEPVDTSPAGHEVPAGAARPARLGIPAPPARAGGRPVAVHIGTGSSSQVVASTPLTVPSAAGTTTPARPTASPTKAAPSATIPTVAPTSTPPTTAPAPSVVPAPTVPPEPTPTPTPTSTPTPTPTAGPTPPPPAPEDPGSAPTPTATPTDKAPVVAGRGIG